MISFKHKGDFSKLTKYLKDTKKANHNVNFEMYAQKAIAALTAATPVESGETARAWTYEIKTSDGETVISFHNSNIQNGVPIAIILQYGHATGTGGWVQGRDYINPAIQPVFDEITNNLWREVTKS